MTTDINRLHTRITDLQLRIDDLRKGSQDPREALTAALKELSTALEDLDVAHEEIRQQDESLQSACLAIEAQRQRYIELFDSAPDCYLVTDLTGIIKEANVAATVLLMSSLVGRPISAFFDDGDLDRWLARLDRLKKDGLVRDWESSIRGPGGSAIPVVISASTTRDSGGEPSGLLWQVHDITKRKRAEESLAASEEKYRQLVENISEVIYSLDDRGVIRYISPAVERLTGYRPSEIIGRRFEEFLPDDDRDSQSRTFRSVLVGEEVSNDLRIVTASGEIRWLRASCRPACKDGQPAGLSGIIADITEVKRAETALRENLSFIQRLMDTIPNPIFYKGCTGRYLGCNRAFEDFMGFRKETIIGRSVYELSPKDKADKYREMDDALFSSPGVQVYESSVQDATGTDHDVIFNRATYTDAEDNIAGIVGVILDITDRKRSEKALADKEEFIRSVLSSLKEHIAVLDRDGRIVAVNSAWERFASENCADDQSRKGVGLNYLDVCRRSIGGTSAQEAPQALSGIQAVLDGIKPEFSIEYPCHSPEERRWFLMNVTPMAGDSGGAVVSHIAITDRKLAEEALQKSKDYLDRIINSVGDPIFVTDREHRFVLVNSAMCAIDGRCREDIIGKTVCDLVPKDLADAFIEDDELIFQTGRERAIESDIMYADGSSHSVITKKTLYTDPSGNKFLVGVMRDITERKKAEEDLRRSREKYQNIFENSILGIYQSSPSGRYISVNPAFARLFGFDSTEEMIASVTDIGSQVYANPRDRDRARKLIFEQGFLEGLELEVQRRDGTVFWVSMNARMVQDEIGQHFDGTVEDITNRKRAEEAIKESERRLSDIINFLPDATFVIDRDKKVIAWNRAIEELTGISKSEMLGKGDYAYAEAFYGKTRPLLIDLLDDPDPDCNKYDNLVRKGDTLYAEIYIPGISGKQGAYVWAKASPLLDDKGDHIGAIESIRDITERKQAEETRERLLKELESKNTEMERFIYTVSHDLRSPLITINGFVGFLKSDLTGGKAQRAETDLKMITSAITRMDRLLNDTLELSRIGRIANPPEAVPFFEIAREAVDQVSGKIREKGVRVEIEQSLPMINADRMRMVEVLTNLIENSLKYMGDKERPEISIGCRQQGAETAFFVKDSGIGIDQSQHQKVFELFYKVDRNSEGSGAGLAIVKRIIEVHGGRIWIESEKGEGSTILFTLPGPGQSPKDEGKRIEMPS